MRYLIVLGLLALSVSAFASTADSAQAAVTVAIAEYVQISPDLLEPWNVTVVQEAAPSMVALENGWEFVVFKNCDVHLSATCGDLASTSLLSNSQIGPPVLTDSLNTAVAIDEGVDVDNNGVPESWENGAMVEDGTAIASALWANCTENNGEPWRVRLQILREGLCDHAGSYSGTLTVNAVAWDH